MRALLTFLIKLSVKARVVTVVAALCGGAVTAYYASPLSAAVHPVAANQTAWGQVEHLGDLGHGAGPDHCKGPVPVVPEANAGLALIPIVAAILFFSSRRLWLVRPAPAAGSQTGTERD